MEYVSFGSFLIARSVNIKGTHLEQNFKALSVNIERLTGSKDQLKM